MTEENFKLSEHAMKRLQEMNGQDGAKSVFTSDLSVNEYVCVKEAGFEPLGLVMGSSVYHIGFQSSSWSKSMEMEVLSQAMYSARELAIERMEEEAKILQADGIVGVRLHIKKSEWGDKTAEFIAIGTAVKATKFHKEQNFLTTDAKPFTSDLSGQDFWTLLKTGHRPLALVMGICVYHIGRQSFGKMLSRYGDNTELVHYTQALYDAREIAMERMQAEAAKAQALGVVGVQVKEESHAWESHIIEYSAIGTAITAMESYQDKHELIEPQMILTLNDK